MVDGVECIVFRLQAGLKCSGARAPGKPCLMESRYGFFFLGGSVWLRFPLVEAFAKRVLQRAKRSCLPLKRFIAAAFLIKIVAQGYQLASNS